MGLPSQRCATAQFCGKALSLDHNGEVFSCDHYPEYRLGNLHEAHWAEMAYAKCDALSHYCRAAST